jgi:hypothetical protein
LLDRLRQFGTANRLTGDYQYLVHCVPLDSVRVPAHIMTRPW